MLEGLIGLVLPLWVVMSMLGTTLGVGSEDVQGRYVYVTDQRVSDDWQSQEYYVSGTACDNELFSDGGSGWFPRWCSDNEGAILPRQTIKLIWPNANPLVYGDGFDRYLLAHELYHLRHGRNGPVEDPNNEVEATATGCREAWGWWCSFTN